MPVTMSVELAHDDCGDAFEADALNVSAGGLGMRSAMLPDVGQRMTCRFAMPELGEPCEAEGEVVWASDTGSDAGEFGIRFDTLEPRVGAALARWVASLEDAPAASPGKKPGRSVRVQLDGVASPIDAEVAMRSEGVLRVEQPLPFLSLGTGAVVVASAGGGRPAASERRVLRSVELRVEGDVPRLVLELVSFPSAERTVDEPLDDLLVAPVARGRAAAALDDEPARADAETKGEPVRAANEDDERSADDDGASAGVRWDSPDDSEGALEPALPSAALADARPRSRRDDEARAVRLDVSDRVVSVDALVASANELSDPAEEPTFAERARALGAAAGPALARAMSALRHGWAVVVATAGPRLRALADAVLRGVRALADAVRERAPGALQRVLGRAPKRRTTAAPPAGREPTAARRTQARTEPVAIVRKVSPRAVVAGVLALAAIALVVRAMASGDASAEDVPVHEVAAPPSAEPATVASTAAAPAVAPVEPTPEASVPAVEAAAAPAPVAPTASATPPAVLTLPGTMPEPTTEAGRIPAPTFPAVGEGASAEVTTAATARTIDDDGDLSFGAADVPHGRTTTLRMSLPVAAIEGESDATGFTVTFHGALSLDRAGPIAAANPSVERAAILNRGDHAVLTVRFVAGRTPAYRVEASGASATITIGR